MELSGVLTVQALCVFSGKKKKKEIHSLLVPNLVLVVSLRIVSWFQ